MDHIVAGHHGREAYERFAVDLDCTSFGETYESASFDSTELSDRELLEIAAEDAVDAQRAGWIGGPVLDEVALRRTRRRAERADIARVLRTEGAIA